MLLRFASVLIAISFLASISQGNERPSKSKYKIRWILQHKARDRFSTAIETFKSTIAKKTNGEVSVEIFLKDDVEFNGHSPVRNSEIAGAVMNGQFEMGQAFTQDLTSYSHKMHIFSMPFLFNSYVHLENFYDSNLGKELLASLEPSGLKGASFAYSGGFNLLVTDSKPVRKIKDLSGLRIGAYNPIEFRFLSTIGAKPILYDYNRPFLSTYENTNMDGVLTAYISLERTELAERVRFINELHHNVRVSIVFFNKHFFDSLPEKYKNVVLAAARQVGEIERKKSIQANSELIDELKSKYGIKFYQLSNVEIKQLQNESLDVQESFANEVGSQFLEAVRSMGQKTTLVKSN